MSSEHWWVAPGSVEPSAPAAAGATQAWDPYPGAGPYPSGGYPLSDPMVPGYRPLVRIATVDRAAVAVTAISAVYLVMVVLSAVTAFEAGDYYATATSEDLLSGEQPLLAQDVVSYVTLPVAIAAFMLSGVWLYTIRGNVDQIDRSAQRLDRVWAWLGWVVPIVSLWFPYVPVADAARPSSHRRLPLRRWWGAWLVANGLSTAGGLLVLDVFAQTGAVRRYGPVTALGAAGFAVAFGLWVVIVRRLTRAQCELLAAHPAPSSGLQ